MTSRKTKTIVGIFVLGAVAIVCAIVVILGSGIFRHNTVPFVLYFGSSVRGLTTGAAVYFNGVRIGRVSDLKITPEGNDLFKTPVFIELEREEHVYGDEPSLADYMSDPQNRDALIQRGLRAQLSTSSFITGLLVVDLDIFPNAPKPLEHDLIPYLGIPQIPTIPSSIDSVLSEFSELPLSDIAEELVRVLKNINTTIEVANLGQISKDLQEVLKTVNGSLKEYTKVANRLDESVNTFLLQATASLKKMDKTLLSVDNMAKNGGNLLDENSATMQELAQTMNAVMAAAESITALAQLLEFQPNALIFGKGD